MLGGACILTDICGANVDETDGRVDQRPKDATSSRAGGWAAPATARSLTRPKAALWSKDLPRSLCKR
jgi:hypothetical protein